MRRLLSGTTDVTRLQFSKSGDGLILPERTPPDSRSTGGLRELVWLDHRTGDVTKRLSLTDPRVGEMPRRVRNQLYPVVVQDYQYDHEHGQLTIILWDTDSVEAVSFEERSPKGQSNISRTTLGNAFQVTGWTFSADGRLLAAAVNPGVNTDITIRAWGLPTFADLSSAPTPEFTPLRPIVLRTVVRALAYSRTNRLLALSGSLRVSVYDTGGEQPSIRPIWYVDVDRWASPRHDPVPLEFSPVADRLMFAAGQELCQWSFADRQWSPQGSLVARVTLLRHSPDGRLMALALEDGSVALWGIEERREVGRFDWGIGPVHALTFSPDGLLCAIGGGAGQIVVWDVDA